MHIQKVLNSSVVLVQDDSGEESILLGKGHRLWPQGGRAH